MKIKSLSIVFALLFGMVNAQSQPATGTQLFGHAIDAKTGEHIPFITITFEGTTIGVAADATGHYAMKNLSPGRYTAAALAIGYETQKKEIVIENGKSLELNFTMEPVAFNLDEVVITSSRTQVNRREAPTIVNVIDGQLFERTSSNTLAEALNFQSGLRVEYSCSNCGVPQLRINGLEGQYSQILLDSRPLFSSLANVYGLEQLPVGMVERVEVIRGGGSALYGSNAIGGVVNIITKEPVRNSFMLSNTTSFMGSAPDVNTALNGSFVTDDYRAGIYVFGMIRDRKQYDRDDDEYSDIPKLGSETIGFRGYYKTGDYSKLTAEYHHIREYRRGGNHIDRPPHEADLAEQLRHAINGGGLKYDIYSKNYQHRANIYASYQDIARDSYFGTQQKIDAYGTTSDKTFVGGAQYSYRFQQLLFSPAELTIGMEFDNNELHDIIRGHDHELRQSSTTTGGFLQNEWKSEKINLVLGARLDKHNKINNPVFSPRANVRYTPVENMILRAGYTSGYRAPQAYDEDLHVGAVGGEVSIIKISDDLKPEYSHSVTASADFYKSFGKLQTNLLMEGFYTNLKDVFALTEDGHDSRGNLILIRENASGATVAGINAELKLATSDNNYMQIGYTFQRSRYKNPHAWSEEPAVEPVKQMLRTPDHYGYVALNFSPVKRLLCAVNGTYTGDMLVPHFAGYINNDALTKTPSFFDAGFKLAYDFRITDMATLQVNFGMKNVFDQFQKDLDKGMMRDAGYIYGPLLPRTIFFGIKYSL